VEIWVQAGSLLISTLNNVSSVFMVNLMSCEEYEQMANMQHQMQRNTWARFTYRENAHLRAGVAPDMAKDLARQARARVIEIGKQMRWHREYCQECKVRS
jgi:hypothetical protein